jgi:uncharacterized protein
LTHIVSHIPFVFAQAIPGVLEYEGARIQLLDLPGIVEGAAMGRGRGRQVISVAKTADVIIIMSEFGRFRGIAVDGRTGLMRDVQ